MRTYYDRRASTYEDIYLRDDPPRREELAAFGDRLRTACAGADVVEFACGTGFWTARYADVARRVVAFDLAPGMLAEARAKGLPADTVLVRADAYAPPVRAVDVAVAGFWVSHIPRDRLHEWVDAALATLRPDGELLLIDNVYLDGVGGELIHRPGERDTYKRRHLPDGSAHDVLKNYFTAVELTSILTAQGAGARVDFGRCTWTASVRASRR